MKPFLSKTIKASRHDEQRGIKYYTEYVKNYLLEQRKLTSLKSWRKVSPETVRNELLQNWLKYSIVQKAEIILAIDKGISLAKQLSSNAGITEQALNVRIKHFKKILNPQEGSNWKTALLGSKIRFLPYRYFVELKFNADAMHEVKFNDKARFMPIHKQLIDFQNSYAMIGSTFLSNKKQLLQAKKAHVLDSVVTAYCYDTLTTKIKKSHSVIIALGDGCGGHFGDDRQDKAIARVAHFASKYIAQLMGAYHHVDKLKQDLPKLFPLLTQLVKHKLHGREEGTTLVAGRAFAVRDGYRLIGINIGDSMMVIWKPNCKRIQTLLPARVKLLGKRAQPATAIFPTSYKQGEIQVIDINLPKDSVLMVLSDGIYDHLPCRHQQVDDAKGNVYKQTMLDTDILQPLLETLAPDVEVRSLIQLLLSQAIQTVNKERRKLLKQAVEANQALPQAQEGLARKLEELKQQQQMLDTRWQELKAASNPTGKRAGKKLEISYEKRKAALSLAQRELKEKQQQALSVFHSLEAKTQIQLGDDVTIAGIRLPR